MHVSCQRGISLLWPLIVLAAVALIGATGYGGYRYYVLTQQYASSTAALASTTAELVGAEADKANLADQLAAQLAKNDGYASQITDIASTVGTLTKLSQTDKELLQKYSKVYFLNENYVPSSLSDIDNQYVLNPTKTYQFHTSAKPFLEKMLAEASSTGNSTLILSAYRSFGTQTTLKVSYKVTYGAGANKFSADQGYSEHQLGTAIDLTTKSLNSTSLAFAKTTQYTWLIANAYRYGFILSYPSGNAYYQYEPWHWRFVGVNLATRLHQDSQYFYDLDQRTIDTYLVSIFD